MRRRRVTGRFYAFVLFLLISVFFVVRELLPSGTREAVVTQASATYTKTVDAVVVRNESVSSYEGNGRIEYIASEGAAVSADTDVVDLYSTGYSDRELSNLETVRKNIRAYYQTVFDTIKNPELERLEGNVQAQAIEFKRLVTRKSSGSLSNVKAALEQTLQERQAYLRANRRGEDPRLNTLYEQETTRLNTIASWKTTRKAGMAGVVSFYLDGYETLLTPETLPDLTIEDVRAVLRKDPLAETRSARLRTNLFKVTQEKPWYVLLYSEDTTWNPISGQEIQMQMQGVNGFAFAGKVITHTKQPGGVLARVEVSGEMGPMLNRRSGKMDIGVSLTGFAVPLNAIQTENERTGVVINDAAGGTFVEVEVLSVDAVQGYAMIEPIAQGVLQHGQRVLLP